MASAYRKQFKVPEGFEDILQDLTREVLREQPRNIYLFASMYFKAKMKGENFNWEDSNPRGPKPCDYDKRAGTTSSGTSV